MPPDKSVALWNALADPGDDHIQLATERMQAWGGHGVDSSRVSASSPRPTPGLVDSAEAIRSGQSGPSRPQRGKPEWRSAVPLRFTLARR